MKKFILSAICAICGFTAASAQAAPKFGHLNSQEVIQAMPEFTAARADMEKLTQQYEADLKKKYFGPEGELFKKRTALMTPIQDEVYNAIKDVADFRGYQLVLDRASDTGIIFGSPKIDISDEVLHKLGYSN